MKRRRYIWAAILLTVVAISTYTYCFNAKEALGQTGDFFGGILNPVFAFLSLLAILSTIKLQSDELKLTREELIRSTIAQEKSEKHFEEQARVLRVQQFENTFFSLLNQVNESIKNYTRIHGVQDHVSNSKYNLNTVITYDVIVLLSNSLKKIIEDTSGTKGQMDKINNNIENLQKIIIMYDSTVTNIFMLICRIIKVTDDSEFLSDGEKSEYIEILKIGLDLNILHLLFISYCQGNGSLWMEFKRLIEKYSFFKYMPFEFTCEVTGKYNTQDEIKKLLSSVKRKYEIAAFSGSEFLKGFEIYENGNFNS